MYRLRNYLLCVLISILLVFAFAAAEIAVFAKSSASDPQTYRSLIDEKNIADDVYRTVSEKFESTENATGIPASVYTEHLTPENVKNIMNGIITDAFDYIYGRSSTFEYSGYDSEFSEMKASVEKFFDEYASSEGIKKDETFSKKVDSVYENARDTVLENADVFQLKKIEKAGYLKYAGKALKYISPAFAGSLTVCAVLILLLVLANLKKITNVFYWLSVSLGITSVFYLAAGIFLRVTGYFDRFAIKAAHIFRAMTGAMYSFTDSFIIINAFAFALSIIFMIIFAAGGKEKAAAGSESKINS